MNPMGDLVISKTRKEEEGIQLGLNICSESVITGILSESNTFGVGELPVEIPFQDLPTRIPGRVMLWFANGIDPIRK